MPQHGSIIQIAGCPDDVTMWVRMSTSTSPCQVSHRSSVMDKELPCQSMRGWHHDSARPRPDGQHEREARVPPPYSSPLLIEIMNTQLLEQVGTCSPQKAGRNDWLG